MPIYEQGYYNLPKFIGEQYPETTQLRCLTVYVPDDDQYEMQLLTLMNVAGKKAAWFTENDEQRVARADIWQKAYRETLLAMECGCFDCDDVADCIETNPATRAAIRSIFNGSPNFPPGEEMTTEQLTADLVAGSNPSCSLSVLYGQCIQAVEYTNSAVENVLQRIEVDSNIVELTDALSEFPLVGWAKEAIGGQIALDLMQYYQNALIEQYLAQYDEILEDQLACDIYCLCKNDCQITVERIFQAYQTRLEGYITLPELTHINDFLEFMVGIEQNSTYVVEFAHWVAWGVAKLGNFFFAKAFNDILGEVLQDASDNIGYTDCACNWCFLQDLITSDGGWVRQGAATNGDWSMSVGWVSGCDPTNCVKQTFIRHTFASDVRLLQWDVTYAAQNQIPAPDGSARPIVMRGYNASNVLQFTQTKDVVYGTGDTYVWTGDATVRYVEIALTPANRAGSCTCASLGGGSQITASKFKGVGDNPFGGDNC